MKRVFAIMLALGLLLCGCGGKGEYVPTGDGLSWDDDYTGPVNTRPREESEQELTMPYYAHVTMNPLLCTDYTNRAFMSLIYQGMFTVDREYKVEPMLCEKYSMSEDMKTYIFYVDAKATFSDGSAVRAADVVATLLAAKESAYYSGRFQHISTVELSEDGGVRIMLDTACENLPILLDIPIIPENQTAGDFPLGSGPYVLDTTGSEWLLRRRSNWWCSADMAVTANAIALEKAESNTQIRDDFQFADLNFVCADPCSDRYSDYRCDFELWDCESGVFTYIAFGSFSTVFDSAEMRAALTYAVDRDVLAESYYRGFGRSASVPASPLSPYYSQTLAEQYAYDPAKFTQTVQDCGKEGGAVTFLVNSDDSLRVRAARFVADQLTQCGLVVTMKEVSGNAYINALKENEFDLYMGQTKLSANMDLSAFFSTKGALRYGTADTAAYTLCLQALENHGNYYTLHQTVMENGLLCPVLFCSRAVYASRGIVTNLTPARDNICYYSLGKTMEKAFIRE